MLTIFSFPIIFLLKFPLHSELHCAKLYQCLTAIFLVSVFRFRLRVSLQSVYYMAPNCISFWLKFSFPFPVERPAWVTMIRPWPSVLRCNVKSTLLPPTQWRIILPEVMDTTPRTTWDRQLTCTTLGWAGNGPCWGSGYLHPWRAVIMAKQYSISKRKWKNGGEKH